MKRIAGGLMQAVLAAASLSGCDATGPCVPGIDQEGRYRADVVELYDERSQFMYNVEIIRRPGWPTKACSGADGIGPGASLVLQATGEMNRRRGFCDSVTAELSEAPPELTVVGVSTSQEVRAEFSVALSAMFATADVAFGGCTGTIGLGVYGNGDIYGEPVPGSEPPAVLLRMFSPTDLADATCAPCYDNFVVKFSKL